MSRFEPNYRGHSKAINIEASAYTHEDEIHGQTEYLIRPTILVNGINVWTGPGKNEYGEAKFYYESDAVGYAEASICAIVSKLLNEAEREHTTNS